VCLLISIGAAVRRRARAVVVLTIRMRVDLDSNEVYCASFAVVLAATLMDVLGVMLLCCGIARKVGVCASL
jgi:hypothetical protein